MFFSRKADENLAIISSLTYFRMRSDYCVCMWKHSRDFLEQNKQSFTEIYMTV